ncbi:MAG: NAD(P)H-hydrate dehydratase [Lachnospiraceae bacterium]|nr:NAD(P)H-hydrate dehydratase [Lachnospiraceae bacterium]
MRHILTASQMQARDLYMINEIGVPSSVLMERAALAIADEAASYLERAGKCGRVLCVCGSGNNGGDGAACARILFLRGIDADLYIAGDENHFSDGMQLELAICRKLGIKEVTKNTFAEYDVIVDALFGIGLSRDIEGDYARVIGRINAAGAFVIAADISSGIHADTGKIMGCAVQADVTVTMQFMKPGMLLYPGADYSGRVLVADIGIADMWNDDPWQPRKNLPSEDGPQIYSMEDTDIPASIPKRIASGNKGTFGKILVIAGSKNMSGAAYFSALSAMRMGAGMVRIVTAKANREIIQRELPEALLSTYSDAIEAEDVIDKCLDWADVICMGPGLGTDETAESIVKHVLGIAVLPLVLDADGINCLYGKTQMLKDYRGMLFITPHMGEMGRLVGKTIAELKVEPVKAAAVLAASCDIVCVLKDARTCTALPNGKVFINRSGNDGMATAGSGDVLSGILSGLLAQNCDVLSAAPLAVHIHGRAGDAAADEGGTRNVIASDIIAHLKDVVR